MTVTVKIPTPLRPVTGGLGELKVDGATVGGVELQPKGETAMLSWWLFAGHRGRPCVHRIE